MNGTSCLQSAHAGTGREGGERPIMDAEQASGSHLAFVHRQLLRLIDAACRWPVAVLALALAVAAISIYASATRLEYRTERGDLVSPRKEYQQRWREYLAEFGDDDDIVVVVKGADRAWMETALEALGAELERLPKVCDRLFYKVDLRSLRNRALLFLSADQIHQIQTNLQTMKLLLDFGPVSWRSLSLMSLLREARHRVAALHPDVPLTPADDQFFTQLLSISRTAAAFVEDPSSYHTPWGSLVAQPPEQKDLLAEPQYFFSGDGTLAFLLVRPIKETGSFTGARTSVEAVRGVVASQRDRYPELEFGLTGLPVLETDEMVAAQRDTHRASWLAIGGVTLLFFIVYRSIYYPLLTVGTLLLGTSWAMGWTTLTVGHLNILSATFAVMLIGMGDYGVLWVMRYERERQRGVSVRAALRYTAICVGGGTVTAAFTTAVAFFAAMLADFQGVTELGWIAGSGVLLCALACFTILPATLTLFDRRQLTGDSQAHGRPITLSFMPRGADAWLPGFMGRSRWVLAGCLLLGGGLALLASRVGYDHNLLHLQAHDLDSVRWELTLIDHTAGASWRALSYTSSPEAALALKARYEQLPSVSRVVEVATLVPAGQDQKLPLLREIQGRLSHLPPAGVAIPHLPPNLQELRTELATLAECLSPLVSDSGPALLGNLRKALTSLHDKLRTTPTAASLAAGLQLFDEQLAGDLAADLHRLRAVSTPAAITLDDLPVALRERFVGRTGKWLLQVFARDCLWDFEPLEHFAAQISTIDPDATGKPFATVEGLKAMKNGFERAGFYAFAAIVAVLFWDFRRPGRTLVALSPLVLGILLALGILGLFGLPLNPANMIALPLVLGVGVDNGVHILHDFFAVKAEGRRVLSRSIGRGVLVKALTTMIGFGTLMISSQRGLAGLGFCLTLGVGCCMFAALIFLPAVLQQLRSPFTDTIPTADDAAPLERIAA